MTVVPTFLRFGITFKPVHISSGKGQSKQTYRPNPSDIAVGFSAPLTEADLAPLLSPLKVIVKEATAFNAEKQWLTVQLPKGKTASQTAWDGLVDLLQKGSLRFLSPLLTQPGYPESPQIPINEIIVKFKRLPGAKKLAQWMSGHGLELKQAGSESGHLFYSPGKPWNEVLALADAIDKEKNVAYATPNFLRITPAPKPSPVPNKTA